MKASIMPKSELIRPNPWALVQDETVFDCPYFITRNDRVKDGAGRPHHYYHVKMKNFGIAVVPIDREGHTILVGQQRYLLNQFTWEVVRGGGKLDLPALDSAKKELSEETGYQAKHWLQLYKASASPGVTDEFAVGFVAWGLQQGEPHPDAGEELLQRRIPFSDVVTMVLSGEIADLASSALVLGIQLKLERGELPASLEKCLRAA
jgi:8-oxo-dGTP pyrophosphatase MutT (NUDIX family)